MKRPVTIYRGRKHVIKAVGQRGNDELCLSGYLGVIFNISAMAAAAERAPHVFRPLSFIPAEGGCIVEQNRRHVSLAHADAMPPEVLRTPGVAIRLPTDGGCDVGYVIDGRHRLSRLYREGSTRPWCCHGFTPAQAAAFIVQYFEATHTGGWRLLPLREVYQRGYIHRSEVAFDTPLIHRLAD